jgi:predicted  nucleic acid-binding Zn-ribbon protein
MNDHSHFEELAALEAGGFLSSEEHVELREHAKVCVECRQAEEEFRRLVHFGLPATVSPVREFVDMAKTRPDSGMRSRFLRRAGLEGIVFSPGVDRATRLHGRRVGFFVAAATALATLIVMSALYGTYRRPASGESVQAQQQVDHLKRENSALTASLSHLNESVAAGQREIQTLRAELAKLAKAENLRGSSEQARGEAERSSSRNAQLLDESRNQEKLLAEARDEAARSSQLRVEDEASMVEQQARITELTNKLRIASATLDQERQLAAAGKDIRELMAARQLHVIDVRDTDPNGNPSKAFGRVFLTEGKSLTFYAFDLNEDRVVDAKRSFQVWATPQTGKNSAVRLGFLHVDAKALGRWVLKVENPELVKEISSVFVTVEPTAGGKQPSGQKMLYAYLGEANHP